MRGELALIEEHLDETLILRERRQHALECDGLLEATFADHACGVDLCHSARSDAEKHLVAAEAKCACG